MPNYDLSSANFGRVAGVEVDRLRIAGQDVWVKPASIDTIFNENSVSLNSFNDATDGSWLGHEFYRPSSGSDYEILSVGIYVPSGSSLIGLMGHVGLQFQSTSFDPDFTYSNQINVQGNDLTAPSALVAGWNWISYLTPKTWSASSPYVLGAYSYGVNYLHDSTLTTDEIPSTLGLFTLAEYGSASIGRTWFSPGGDPWLKTTAHSYGIDLRVRVAE